MNYSDETGYTALHAASENGHLEIVQILVKNGANVKAKTTDGNTPSDLARISEKLQVVNYLDNLL